MPVVVDHRVAQNAIKPRYRRFLIAQFPAPLDPAHECRLQNVFGDISTLHASL